MGAPALASPQRRPADLQCSPPCAILPCYPPPTPARFELHVYTMGDRDYAAEMAKLLDPSGRFFHGRVISAVSWLCGAASLG